MIKDRAMQVHGKICMVETRGPKHSLVLSVYREYNGTSYQIRRGAGSKTQRIMSCLAETLSQMEIVRR